MGDRIPPHDAYMQRRHDKRKERGPGRKPPVRWKMHRKRATVDSDRENRIAIAHGRKYDNELILHKHCGYRRGKDRHGIRESPLKRHDSRQEAGH